jgi:hypothetical protein
MPFLKHCFKSGYPSAKEVVMRHRSFWGRVLAAFCTVVVTGIFAVTPAYAQTTQHHGHAKVARHHQKKIESDFDCAVHTAYGEAKGLGRVEAAVVINGLVKSARTAGHSVCTEAHVRYKPRFGSTPDIVAAAHNVFSQKGSWVPARFRNATEFRSAQAPRPQDKELVRIGQVTRRGNVYYAKRMELDDTENAQ